MIRPLPRREQPHHLQLGCAASRNDSRSALLEPVLPLLPPAETANAQQCRRGKGLMRHTAASCFLLTRACDCVPTELLQLRSSGGRQDGDRNFTFPEADKKFKGASTSKASRHAKVLVRAPEPVATAIILRARSLHLRAHCRLRPLIGPSPPVEVRRNAQTDIRTETASRLPPHSRRAALTSYRL